MEHNDAEGPSSGEQAAGLGRPVTDEYAELKRLVSRHGLLDKGYAFHVFSILLNFVLLAAGIALLVVAETWPPRIFSVVLLAYVYGQFGYIAHDASHLQICRSNLGNELIALTHWNLVLGLSASWWTNKHNRHHAHPNRIDHDPDIDFPIIAFTEEEALAKRGGARFMVKHQAIFFPFLTLFMGFNMQLYGLHGLLRGEARRPVVELVLLAIHMPLYFGLPIYLFGVGPGLLLAFIHHGLVGWYLAFAFAPNHKGMPILDAGTRLGFLREQVITSRNVRGGWFIDTWYGGLNYQIEHHLFPNMQRNKLGAARKVVGPFCRERSIAYYETGAIEAFKEIFRNLHRVSAPLRASRGGGVSRRDPGSGTPRGDDS